MTEKGHTRYIRGTEGRCGSPSQEIGANIVQFCCANPLKAKARESVQPRQRMTVMLIGLGLPVLNELSAPFLPVVFSPPAFVPLSISLYVVGPGPSGDVPPAVRCSVSSSVRGAAHITELTFFAVSFSDEVPCSLGQPG